jgi:uncharacterized protein YbaP (TraB family)
MSVWVMFRVDFWIASASISFLVGCASGARVRIPELATNPHFFCFSKESLPPSYLLGTFHKASYQTLPSFIWIPFKQSKMVFLEDTFFRAVGIATMKENDFRKRSPKDKTISQRLSESQLKEVKRVFNLANVSTPIDDFTAYGVSFFYQKASEKFTSSNVFLSGKRETIGFMDKEIVALAEKYNIPKVGLDRFDRNLLAEDPTWLQLIPENPIMEDPKLAAQKLQALVDAYFQGSETGILAHADSLTESFILAGRNKIWIPYFSPFLSSQIFIAVGAAHLYGTEGLIELLKKQGYQFHRLRSKRDLELCQRPTKA